MGAMTAGVVLPLELGDENDLLLDTAAKVFEGSAVGLASGYAHALVNGDIFAGHAIRGADNTAGQAGDLSVKVRTGVYRMQVTLGSVAQANVGALVYMTYDGTYTLSSSSAVKVGRITRYVATNTCVVEFHAMAL